MDPFAIGVTQAPLVALSARDFPAVDCGPDLAPAHVALRGMGVDIGSADDIDRALRVAFAHSSFVYENEDLVDGLTVGILEALYGVGLHFLHRSVASAGFNSGGGDHASTSRLVGQVARRLERWAEDQSWIEEAAALGKGQQEQGINSTIRKRTVLQLAGMFCLLNKRSDAALLLRPVVVGLTSEPQSIEDPRTELLNRLGRTRIQSTVSQSGPSHAPVFRADIVDDCGRRASGVGPTKKGALAEASLDFLSSYFRRERRDLVPPPPQPRLIDIGTTRSHAQLVRSLGIQFGVVEASLGMLGQSLIHSSWTYENDSVAASYHQRSNKALGAVGAHVANFEACLTVAANALTGRTGEFVLRTNSNREWARVFSILGLSDGLLLGRGQASAPVTQEIASTALQAVLAAVWVSRQSDELLIDTWPSRWQPALQILAPAAPTPPDPSTEVERRLEVAGITRDFMFKASGPAHQRGYQATLCLRSPALGRKITITGTSASGKTNAKHSVAKVVQAALKDSCDVDYLVDALKVPKPNTGLVTYLLSAQLAGAQDVHSGPKKWREAGLLGSQWLREPSRLVDWAASADALLDPRRRERGYAENEIGSLKLARIYSEMIRSTDGALPKIRDRLRGFLNAIDLIDSPDGVSSSEMDYLIQLCAYFRALSLEAESRSLVEVIDGCAFVYRDRIAVPQAPSPLVILAAPEIGMIESIVAAVLRTSSTIEISRTATGGATIRGAALNEDAEKWAGLAEMWSGVTPRASCFYRTDCIEIVIAEATLTSHSGPFEAAVAAALASASFDIDRRQAADLADQLHDLKNQLGAAQQALVVSTVGKAAQLRQQLTSVEHLDRAKLIGRRIGMIAALMSIDDAAVSDLGAALRDYQQAALSRWSPRHVLRIPPIRQPVLVAIDPTTLSALLDNLTTNSLSAMPEGGTVSIDLHPGSQVVVIEVSDDGPGLPPSVFASWQAGEPITSTKLGGNGLGILGVKSLLDRLGGSMQLAPSGTGARWILTLPVPNEIPSSIGQEGSDEGE